MVTESKGILADESLIAADPKGDGIWFQQTPKYHSDSTNQESMARFYIEDNLIKLYRRCTLDRLLTRH